MQLLQQNHKFKHLSDSDIRDLHSGDTYVTWMLANLMYKDKLEEGLYLIHTMEQYELRGGEDQYRELQVVSKDNAIIVIPTFRPAN